MRKLSLIFIIILIVSLPKMAKILKSSSQSSNDKSFKAVEDAYVKGFLRHYPVVNTYLGGAGLDPSLKEVDGMLRDHSQAAIEAEDKWLEATLKSLEKFDSKALSPGESIDRDVAVAQIRFLIHQ